MRVLEASVSQTQIPAGIIGEDNFRMRYKCLLVAIVCLLIALQAQGGSEEIAINDLPPIVERVIKDESSDTKILYVRMETEDGKYCYSVMIAKAGRIREIYVSPDGVVVAYKKEPLTLNTIVNVDDIIDFSLIILLPSTIAGLLLRWTVQTARGKRLSVLSSWLLAWLGASVAICVILLLLSTFPREKDIVIVAIISIVWGAISASLVEVASLTVESVLGYRSPCWRWVIGLCGVGLAFLTLSIPIEILRIERTNQHLRALALRPPSR